MSLRVFLGLLAVTVASACAREPTPIAITDSQLQAMSQQAQPAVERAVGLKFKRPPSVAIRSKDQVRAYIAHKLATDLPPAKLAGVTAAYRLFRMIPDTLDLSRLLLALYSEQVAGYYDPDSATLYVVRGSEQTIDPSQLRLVLAHELVHALQGQYVKLADLLNQRDDNDRLTALQSVMEGQATLASVLAMLPDQKLEDLPEFWGENRNLIKTEQQKMPVFSSAPLLIQETLVFPYFGGADFVRWFAQTYPDTVPFGPRLPVSTEQILHPEHYRSGDAPVVLRFPSVKPGAQVWQDNLGEFEIRILLNVLTGDESLATAGAAGWGGDRFVVLRGATGDALVWWSVWDTPQAAGRFRDLLAKHWAERPGRRSTIDLMPVEGHAGVRLVDGPVTWSGWNRVPAVTIAKR